MTFPNPVEFDPTDPNAAAKVTYGEYPGFQGDQNPWTDLVFTNDGRKSMRLIYSFGTEMQATVKQITGTFPNGSEGSIPIIEWYIPAPSGTYTLYGGIIVSTTDYGKGVRLAGSLASGDTPTLQEGDELVTIPPGASAEIFKGKADLTSSWRTDYQ